MVRRDMTMLTLDIRIDGTSPLLMCRFSEQAEQSVPGGAGADAPRPVHHKAATPREIAETLCYRLPDGQLYIPASAVQRAFVEAAADFKHRGKRQSLKYQAGAAFLCTSDVLLFEPPLFEFEVDSRPVTITATKGRVMRHRPRIEKWSLRFTATLEDDLISSDTARAILTHAGRIKGIGDFRPEKRGPFGRFAIGRWDVVSNGTPSAAAR
jgi:hypothetical protein